MHLHHAHLVVGDTDSWREHLSSLFSRIGVSEVGNPDLTRIEVDTFGIELAREVSRRVLEKPFGEVNIVTISASQYSAEAQNALLKTVEEPASNAKIFIHVREEGVIIPTLRSRMNTVRLQSSPSSDQDPKEFLKMTLKDRIEFAKEFEGDLSGFLDGLLHELVGDERVKNVFELRRFASDRSASERLILEHLALVLP